MNLVKRIKKAGTDNLGGPVRRPICREDVHAGQRTAFTLIELLVVIAIIAILAAMLMPALQHAREVAYEAQGISNQRHIGLATSMFLNDFGHYPYPCNGITEGLQESPLQDVSRFADSWGSWGAPPQDPITSAGTDSHDSWRLYADELMDSGHIATTDLFSDPGLPEYIWEVGEYGANMPEVYGKAEISYHTNIFLQCSSMNQRVVDSESYSGANPVWEAERGGGAPSSMNAFYNHFNSGVLHAPSKNMWIGDQSRWDGNPAVWPSWDMASRHNGAKLFCFFDGHVSKVQNDKWYSSQFWGDWVTDSSVDLQMWDVIHANPQGGSWNKMDDDHY